MDRFKFQLGQIVKISLSGAVGEVKGRAEYNTGSPNQYNIYHLDGNGNAVHVWFDEQNLVSN